MAHIEATAGAGFGVPAGTHTATGASGVKAHAGNHEEDMPALGVDCEPLAETGVSPFQEIAGGGEFFLLKHAAFVQHKGYRAGTIVGGIVVLAVSAAQAVGFADNFVACGNSFLDARGSPVRHGNFAVTQFFGGVTLLVHVLGRAGVAVQLLLATVESQCQKKNK